MADESDPPFGAGENDERRFRSAMGQLASGVTVVTTVAGGGGRGSGIDHAMTATAFMSVSLEPPLVAVSVARTARIHAALEESGTWAVSILADDSREAATWLAKQGRPLEGQLDHIPYRRAYTGSALLADALAWIECETWATYDGGDHTIVVGRVVAVFEREDGEPRVSGDVGPSQAPMIHHRGGYISIAEPASGYGTNDQSGSRA